MTNRYADVSDIVDSNPNYASDVRDAFNALDAAIVALEDGVLYTQVIASQQAGEDLDELDSVYLASDAKWYKIDTDDATPALGRMRGFVTESGGITSGNTGTVKVLGEVDGFTGLTPWGAVYASTTAGGYTQTKPTVVAAGGQKALVPMGIALSATKILALRSVAKYLKRESLANDGTLTIVHHSDAATQERRLDAIINAIVSGSSLEAYADTNQDEDVALKDRTVNTYTADQCSGGTPDASTEQTSYEADKAFDDNVATLWSALAATGWLEYDFGTNKTIRRYTIRARTTATELDRAPNTWTLEYYDGASWQTADSQSGETGWSSAEQRTYDVSGSYTAERWRINVSANDGDGSKLEIAEMEMMEASTYSDGNEKLAQSFQLSSGDDVGSIKLWLKKSGSPTGNLTVSIQTDSGGTPSGTPVTNGTANTVAASTLSTSYGWIEFTFSTAPSLSASTTYWLVIETADSFSETNYVLWGADGSSPSYTDGEMKSYASSTWSAESKDACFDVLGEGESYPEKPTLGRWSGGTRDIAVRLDDGSASDGDAKTTFKNVSGGTLDVTCVVELE